MEDFLCSDEQELIAKGNRCRPRLYVYHMNLTVQKWTYASSLLVMKQATIIYYKKMSIEISVNIQKAAVSVKVPQRKANNKVLFGMF